MTKQSKMNISPSLSIPLEDFVTSTQVVIAQKGKGKSHLAQVQAEELLGALQQVVAIDPTGAWWGLRSSKDGKSAGYPIAVFGGEHADLPLEPTAGEVIADAIATEHFSAVIDLTLFRKNEALRFMAIFLETLYRKNREALHLFIDEADVVAPQKTFSPEQARCLGASEDIVRRGRIRGIGCTLISQRAQVLNKDVIALADTLTTLGMNHPRDLRAIDDWVSVHGDPKQAKTMIASLPSLPRGEAWMWAPTRDLFERIKVRDKRTFDSGKTPKAGEKRIAPKVLADVDLEKLGTAIADTVERSKASDPKAMRARIVELEKQAAAKPGPEVEIEEIEIVVPDAKQVKRVEAAVEKAEPLVERVVEAINHLSAQLSDIKITIERVEKRPTLPARPPARGGRAAAAPIATAPRPPAKPASLPDGEVLSAAKQRILNALAALEVIGLHQAEKTQLALFAEQSPSSSGYTNNLGALRTLGLIDYPSPGAAALTDLGRSLADSSSAPRTQPELHAYVQRLIGASKWNVLAPLLECYPKAITKDDLATKADVSASSSGYTNNLGSMRSLGLLDYPRPGEVRASDLLFP